MQILEICDEIREKTLIKYQRDTQRCRGCTNDLKINLYYCNYCDTPVCSEVYDPFLRHITLCDQLLPYKTKRNENGLKLCEDCYENRVSDFVERDDRITKKINDAIREEKRLNQERIDDEIRQRRNAKILEKQKANYKKLARSKLFVLYRSDNFDWMQNFQYFDDQTKEKIKTLFIIQTTQPILRDFASSLYLPIEIYLNHLIVHIFYELMDYDYRKRLIRDG